MIVRQHVIDCNGRREFNLYTPGDLQFGADGFSESLWQELAEKVKSDPAPLLIGMGDYSDHWRPTNQAKLAHAFAGDKEFESSMDEMYQSHNQKVFNKLAPLFHKRAIGLGLLSGHHEHQYSWGSSSTAELCEKLRVPYLGRSCFIRLIFREGSRKSGQSNHVWSMKIHAQHGEGGAATIAADVRNLEARTAPYWRADLLLRGHSTKVYAFTIPSLDITQGPNPILVETKITCVNTGGFMRGYLEGNQNNARDTYVSKSNLPPAQLGFPVIHIRLDRHESHTGRRAREVNITVTH